MIFLGQPYMKNARKWGFDGIGVYQRLFGVVEVQRDFYPVVCQAEERCRRLSSNFYKKRHYVSE